MKKSKKYLIIFFILVSITISIFIYLYTKNKSGNNPTNYEATKTSSAGNTTNSIENTSNNNNISQDNNIPKSEPEKTEPSKDAPKTPNTPAEPPKQPIETNIASFSTKIYSKDSSRQNNINITCRTLNNKIIKNGETFSFCNAVGPATSSKGYKKADIFDNNGAKKKGLRRWKLSSK